MQVTIDIEPQTLSLLQEAERKGIALDELLRDALHKVNERSHLQETVSAEEWSASLKRWADNRPSLPAVSDEALRRENLYEDRS